MCMPKIPFPALCHVCLRVKLALLDITMNHALYVCRKPDVPQHQIHTVAFPSFELLSIECVHLLRAAIGLPLQASHSTCTCIPFASMHSKTRRGRERFQVISRLSNDRHGNPYPASIHTHASSPRKGGTLPPLLCQTKGCQLSCIETQKP